MAETAWAWPGGPHEALAAAVVRIMGRHDALGGAGFVIAPSLVLTCAHVVSDALERPRQEPVAEGTPVVVEFPLSEPPAGGDARPRWPAVVETWVPIRADRTGDLALLRLPEPVPGARPLAMADPGAVGGGQVRVVGFPRDAPGGDWFEGRLGGPTSEGWMQLSRAHGQTVHVRPGFSGSPVWDDALSAVIGLVVAAQPVGDAQQAYALRTRTIVREIPALGHLIRPPSPFRGLKPYEEGDADVFFGRKEDVDTVVTVLYQARTVTMYGPSGCGKSSLALAGVVPRVRADGHDALVFNAGRISSMRSALATELYEAVRSGRYGPARVDGAGQIEKWLADKGLADTLHGVRGTTAGELIVVLDQAEALLNRTPAELDELTDLLFARDGGARVLVMLRSDLVDAVLRHPRLGPALLGGRTLPLTPMSAGQLEEVITKPVERLPAVRYEPGLARRILDDAGGEPGVLPLLGFVLQQLWDQQDGGYLRNAAYERLGRVSGALEQHAKQTWSGLFTGRPEQEEAARRLLTKLVRMLPDSQILLRRRLTRDEVDETQWEIAAAFAKERLLVLHGGEGRPESAELAHEALITAWPMLRDQVDRDRRFLAGQAELEQDVRRRQRGGPLLTGAQLAAIDQWAGGREDDLTEEQRRFLASSREQARTERRRRRTAWFTLAVVLVLIVALATFGIVQRQVSAVQAGENASRMLASSIEDMLEGDPGLAALAAVAAYEVAPTQEATNALLQRYDQLKDAAWMLAGFEGLIMNTAMSADGKVLLGTSVGGRGTLFVRHAGGRVLRRHLGLPGNLAFPLISRDGRRIAYARDGSDSMFWHDIRHAENDIIVGPAHQLPGAAPQKFASGGRDGSLNIVSFSPSAERIATVTFDGRLRVWDLRTQRLQNLPKRFPGLLQVWFGPDEHTLVGARLHGPNSLVSLDLRTGAVREFEDRRGRSVPSSVETALSGDGGVLTVCRKPYDGGKAVYRVIRVSDGRELARYVSTAAYSSCRRPAISPTGDHVAVNEGDGVWMLVGAGKGTPPRRHTGPVISYTGVVGPLLGTPADPVVVHRDRVSVTGWELRADDGLAAYSPPALLGAGRSMVVRIGKVDGKAADRLAVLETEGRGRTLAEVPIPPAPRDRDRLLAVNQAETLVADVSDLNKITVYALPDLREVISFTAGTPPRGEDGLQEPV
ncbi:serine protease, partial [Nonomuraea sp. FMUSA5-5]